MLKSMSDTRRHAHELIDRMPETQLSALVGLLETIVTPPLEDEEISDEEELAVAESIEWLKHNKGIPHEEVLAEFGLTLDDFEKMGRTPLPPEQNGADR